MVRLRKVVSLSLDEAILGEIERKRVEPNSGLRMSRSAVVESMLRRQLAADEGSRHNALEVTLH